MKESVSKEYVFNFNTGTNGGEAFTLTTQFRGIGRDIYINQKLTLNSYGNNAVFNLYDTQLTPEVLRAAANFIEASEAEYLTQEVVEI